ncbi:hypothetical protein E2562_007305 [Oryza meyeriana var. granulata]|uniref:Uncharacterized protein n=1 Tax=Oryza meyeriana var. granulata TaxID=110450 RepID=A0A6G1CZF4_9ORYZ|nr:hypothetical protein E2562_007305 [Oryza meyeriana var. granulata]
MVASVGTGSGSPHVAPLSPLSPDFSSVPPARVHHWCRIPHRCRPWTPVPPVTATSSLADCRLDGGTQSHVVAWNKQWVEDFFARKRKQPQPGFLARKIVAKRIQRKKKKRKGCLDVNGP